MSRRQPPSAPPLTVYCCRRGAAATDIPHPTLALLRTACAQKALRMLGRNSNVVRRLERLLLTPLGKRCSSFKATSPAQQQHAAAIQVGIGPNNRKSVYFDATIADGVSCFSVYNHMFIPANFGDPDVKLYDIVPPVPFGFDNDANGKPDPVGRTCSDSD